MVEFGIMTLPMQSSPETSIAHVLGEAQHSIRYLLDPDCAPQLIGRQINETLLNGGKRIRPALCLLVGRMFRLQTRELEPFARAAELTHCASLAHDDVIDRSALRRGQPTLHSQVGETRAILSGDLLLAQMILELLEGNPSPRAVRLTRELAQAIRDLSIGEWQETAARGRIPSSESELRQILELKTGSLTRWCAAVAPTLLGAPQDVINDCSRFGMNVGLAFQMADDILDFEKGTGKPFAQDFHEGVVNTVSLEMILSHGLHSTFWEAPLRPEWISLAQDQVRNKCTALLSDAHAHLERALDRAKEAGFDVDATLISSGELSEFLQLISHRKS